jgi:hypothetical protein
VLLGKSEYRYVRRIRRLSSATKVLGYESGMDLEDTCIPASWRCPGITYQQAQAHDARHPHDRWILRSASGESLVNPNYPHSHLANVGSASYQRAWARRVSAAAAEGKFDGVEIDNVLGFVSGWTGGPYPTAYPSDLAWKKAMKRFIRFVGPNLKARGLYVLANTFNGSADDNNNNGSTDAAWWRAVAPYLNGLMAEYWEQSPVDLQLFDMNRCCWTGHWYGWLRLATTAQRSGADFFPLQYGSSADVRPTGKPRSCSCGMGREEAISSIHKIQRTRGTRPGRPASGNPPDLVGRSAWAGAATTREASPSSTRIRLARKPFGWGESTSIPPARRWGP